MSTVTISTSEMNTFLRCRRKYYYQYIEKLVPKRQPVPITKGTLIHNALEAYYKGEDWTAPLRDAEAEAKKNFFEEELAEFQNIIADAYKVVRAYIHYARTSGIDQGIQILDVEKPFKVRLPNGHIFEGRMDLIYRNEAGLWIRDHKTTGQIPKEGSRFIDVQTAMYYAAAKVIYKETPLGVEINYIKSSPPKEPKLTSKGTMSRESIDTDWVTYEAALRKAGLNPGDYLDMQEKLSGKIFFKTERMPRPVHLVKQIIKETCAVADEIAKVHSTPVEEQFFPRFIDRSCEWGCPYKDLCHAELIGVNVDFIRMDKYTKADQPVMQSEEDD